MNDLNSKKIPDGYKQTEIGVIPKDWDVVKLNLLSNDIGDGIHSTPKYVDSSNYFFVNGNNLSDGRILITRDTKCISEDEYKSLKKNLDNTTILMSINGTIGNLAFYNNETVVLGKSAAYIKLSQRIDKIFIYYLLQHISIKQFYDNELTGTTIKNLSLASIRATPISIPPRKSEQIAIATVLSDTDALIERLEKLIAKKKAIKQGAMQQLLTGKKRLPGFSGEWETNAFGSMAEINKGQQLNKLELTASGEYPDWNGGIEPSGYTNKWNMTENTITISEGGNSCGFVNYCKTKFWLGGHCYALKIKNTDLDKGFLYQFLKFKEKLIMGLRIGSGLPNIQKKNLNEFELFISKNKKEQVAISTILSDMDSEIEKLEKKRDKYIMLKQGMMQQLLIGKIRLGKNLL